MTEPVSFGPPLGAAGRGAGWMGYVRLLVGGCMCLSGLCIALGHGLNRRRLPAAPVDAALVFGTGLIWKAWARCDMAAQLFQQGLVRRLIDSGGVPVPGSRMTEAAWFRDILVASGVPEDCILLEA